MEKIGFIGMGNMALAIAGGLLEKGKISGDCLLAYAPHYDKLEKNAKRLGFTPCRSLKEMVQVCDSVLVACKAYQIESVLSEIKDDLKDKNVISVAAGWNFERYSYYLDKSTHVQFIMPNTPALVGEGVLLFEATHSLSDEDHEKLMDMMSALGVVVELPSHLMSIGGNITGCGPAFIDLMIEAFGDAGVKFGLPRAQAYQLASQMILGSAKLQLETGLHPGVLKDQVTSPNGITIRGVEALEANGFRTAIYEAINATMEKKV